MYYRLFRGLLAPGVNIIIKYNFSNRGRKVLQSYLFRFFKFCLWFLYNFELGEKNTNILNLQNYREDPYTFFHEFFFSTI
jgi:hypothetical protein